MTISSLEKMPPLKSNSSSSSEVSLLCRVSLPSYAVAMLGERHIVVAGGGGAAKTGVKNGFEIFELTHDGVNSVGESVRFFDTEGKAIMNMAVASDEKGATLAVGHDQMCQLYGLKQVFNGDKNKNISVDFHIKPLASVQTDFKMPEPYQKVVRLSPNLRLMATGGDDGALRIWTYPHLDRTHEIADAHSKEIDDLDFSPDNTKVVSVSKDGHGFVWDVKKGKKHAELGWQTPQKKKYLFKRVRFAKVENSSKSFKLVTISNPSGAGSKLPSFLQRWDGKSFQLEQNLPIEGCLSALAVSSDGIFTATGAMFDGSVRIFTTFNLKCLKAVERCHSTFVTGLEFLPSTSGSEVIRGFNEASVVSISVDQRVCIHHIPRLRTISVFTALILSVAVLWLTFIICAYLGL